MALLTLKTLTPSNANAGSAAAETGAQLIGSAFDKFGSAAKGVQTNKTNIFNEQSAVTTRQFENKLSGFENVDNLKAAIPQLQRDLAGLDVNDPNRATLEDMLDTSVKSLNSKITDNRALEQQRIGENEIGLNNTLGTKVASVRNAQEYNTARQEILDSGSTQTSQLLATLDTKRQANRDNTGSRLTNEALLRNESERKGVPDLIKYAKEIDPNTGVRRTDADVRNKSLELYGNTGVADNAINEFDKATGRYSAKQKEKLDAANTEELNRKYKDPAEAMKRFREQFPDANWTTDDTSNVIFKEYSKGLAAGISPVAMLNIVYSAAEDDDSYDAGYLRREVAKAISDANDSNLNQTLTDLQTDRTGITNNRAQNRSIR